MTQFNFSKMTISELGLMAEYYSTYSKDSIGRMVRMNSRISLESAIKYSSKFMREEMKGEYTYSTAISTEETKSETKSDVFNAEDMINQTMADIRAQQAQAHAARMQNAEKFVDNICRRWASAYGLEAEYDRRK